MWFFGNSDEQYILESIVPCGGGSAGTARQAIIMAAAILSSSISREIQGTLSSSSSRQSPGSLAPNISITSSSDSHFCRNPGFGKILATIVDERWASDRLSDDEVMPNYLLSLIFVS